MSKFRLFFSSPTLFRRSNCHRLKNRFNQKGMTLIEIVIVVAILASLMAILGTQVTKRFQKAKVDQAKIQIGEISKSLDMYYTDCGKYPQTLDALVNNDGSCSNWGPSPYIKKAALKDPWQTDFIYELQGSNFTLISLGADNREGGEGNDADVSNQE
jgi:general secretion pathway protein G